MAQNFRRYKESAIGTAATDIPNGSNFDSYDTIVGISLANILTTTINVDVYIANGGTNYYLVKTAPIPRCGAIQVLDGGATWQSQVNREQVQSGLMLLMSLLPHVMRVMLKKNKPWGYVAYPVVKNLPHTSKL